jgi:hypothetical protein
MLPSSSILPLVDFVILVLSAALCGLAASGHFPNEHRAPSLRSTAGMFVLYGSLAFAILSLLLGVIMAWYSLPVSATVIGSGGALLATLLVLRLFRDQFVNGNGALIVFSGASVGAAAFLFIFTGTD